MGLQKKKQNILAAQKKSKKRYCKNGQYTIFQKPLANCAPLDFCPLKTETIFSANQP